ncbi:MAG: response regulator [Bdellovibrionales bacterium]
MAINKNIIGMINRETLSQPSILLIEDCKCDRVLIKHIMSEYYPFTLIDNAETKLEALQYLNRNQYDLILVDLNLPDTSDCSHIKDIRHHAQTTPMVVITGTHNSKTTKDTTDFGADGIIGKAELIGISFLSAMAKAVNNIEQAA